MQLSNADSPAASPPTESVCGFCQRPIAGQYFQIADRIACGECATALLNFVQQSKLTREGLVRGGSAAVGVAIASGAVWAAITRATSVEWGILAALIGYVTARAALVASRGQRGRGLQIVSAASAVLGISVGKVLLITLLRHSPSTFISPFDFVWVGIAIFTAWRMCQAVMIPFRGPIGDTSLPANAAKSPVIAQPIIPPPDNFVRAALITGVTMLISIVVYGWLFRSWQIATGFVLLILIHELGHVIANVHYKLRASPPIFIPFLGAVINLKDRPQSSWVEAIVGIAGPIAGTIGTLACFAWYLNTGSLLALQLSWFGFTINLFNMLPVPPLDGGRVAAAISPWVWILGLIGLGLMVFDDYRRGRDVSMLLILLLIALPRIVQTLRGTMHRGPYYDIGRAKKLLMGAMYLVLLGLLAVLRWHTHGKLGLSGFL